MSGAAVLVAIAAAATAAGATVLLARVAARLALVDPVRGAAALERRRKLQRHPVAIVGGPALVAGLLAAAGLARALDVDVAQVTALPAGLEPPGLVASALALALAFTVGLVDDLRRDGLTPFTKLALQALSGVPLALGVWARGGGELAALPVHLALGALAACVALNALNTFDNADGAAVSLAALGLALPCPPAAGALLGFLPFNLDRARGADAGSRGTPTAYLGDSGSHLVGMLVLLVPLAWPVLLLPLLDLLRVAIERVVAGQAPWRGDRRHLAHAALRVGLGRHRTVALLCSIAAPALVLGSAGIASGESVWIAVGATATTFAFLVAVALTVVRGERRERGPAEPEQELVPVDGE